MKGNHKYELVIILISILCITWIIPTQSPRSTIDGDIPSSLLPYLSMVVILIAGLALFIKGIVIKKEKEKEKENIDNSINIATPFLDKILSRQLFRFAIIILIIFSYVLGVSYIGFYSITALYLTASLYALNKMSLFKCILGSVILLLISYILFEVVLNVSMPQGLLI